MKIMQNSMFIIYGAGEVGNNIAIHLLQKGYCVQGFLDLNPEGADTVQNIKAYQFDSEVPWDVSKVIVIIALANGNIHKDVADHLYKKGYLYIVFLPVSHSLPKTLKAQLFTEYNRIMLGKCKDITVNKYEEYFSKKESCEDGIIRESDGYIWAFVSQEILFSESYDNWKGDKNKLTGIMDSYNKNIVLRKWYRSLFKYFENEADDCEEYFNIFKKEKTDLEKKKYLCERQKLFQLYKMEYNRGLDFFIETAPLVEWNEEGYFNLVGGHHRTVFLLEQGMRMYPVKMTKLDFDKWCNYDKFEAFIKYFHINDVNQANIPIPHPAYVNYTYKRENSKITLLDRILNYFDSIDIRNMTVLDVSEADGYFARIFARLGAKDVTCYENKSYEVVKKLFDLLYIKKVNLVNEFSVCEQVSYDVVFGINSNAFIYQDKNILNKILNIVKKYIFLEVAKEEDGIVQEYMQIGNFSYYTKIANEVNDGIAYTVYVLVK